ncbi:hypothetical protein C7B65_06320 [Phormidesmis priestleyi ULC007]|uniref:Zinc ribbon domain-containing protein n=1 Tax=Phormidesmis priestleyi ULC007 TaxID=1920490 RepID=A0A2T1DKI7_9CYAN|nr:hypothetical protein [Phormidesmis priestleyi]PSB21010.1 hypothetical protein C7B65_06320 [Phormidesmis priestleyi ULC007]PZO53654.1 MAG: hypothetical protein DCF14_04530 [Phormidesmis priestleyi]
MFSRIRRIVNRFFNRASTLNNEPLNKVSLIVLILIDLFILFNVFSGLNDISGWHISPSQAYPCYSDWQTHQTQTNQNKNYETIRNTFTSSYPGSPSFRQTYQQAATGHLGEVSETCLKFADYKDKIKTPENQKIVGLIDQKQNRVSTIEQSNRKIREQYDSTLLEKIAGQGREQSINAVGAEKAKQELDQNNRTISTLKTEISDLKNQLIAKPESASFIAFLNDKNSFEKVEKGYKQASFWYPSIQLAFQALFLLPLIFVALSVYKFAQRKGYGLISLISWHLLVIFFIPLIFKVFEFLQVGALFEFFVSIISTLFGGLLFLINYVYILLIPLVGFGIIKFFQKFAFNPKIQAANRVQKSECLQCARKIRHHDSHCPHCGYFQYAECPNCHESTYKNLPYCKQCGYPQPSNQG